MDRFLYDDGLLHERLNVNKVSCKSKIEANKILTNTNWIIKRGYYMHHIIRAKGNHIWASKTELKSTSVGIDCYENFKYSYIPVPFQKAWC